MSATATLLVTVISFLFVAVTLYDTFRSRPNMVRTSEGYVQR